jgi:glyoxylase-like metal-dependent hydrolase (beta-lactamase superfamily II)
MEISKGVHMLELESEGFGGKAILHPTLLWDDHGAVLIDTGMPGGFDQLHSALTKAGVVIDQLTAIILTHQDLDHIGGAPELLRELNGNVPVFAHEIDAPYIEGKLPLIKTSPTAMAKALEAMPEDVRSQVLQLCENPPKTKIDQMISDGQELPFCGGIRVIYTPGHTPGHISLYHKASKTLVAADAMISTNGVLRGPIPQTTLDYEIALASLRKFLDFDISTVICYHGGLSTGDIREQITTILRQNN